MGGVGDCGWGVSNLTLCRGCGVDGILLRLGDGWRGEGTYLCSHGSEIGCPRFGWGGRCRRGFGRWWD